jgi:GT2 family glycosyltransferase
VRKIVESLSCLEIGSSKATATLSIVIINYNGESVLPATLKSIKKINYRIEKIILVDDGSTDRSIELAQEILPCVEIVCMRRNTALPNLVRNTGLRRIESDLVFLMDNDLIVEPECISTLVEVWQAHADAAICSPRLVYANDHDKIYTDGQRLHYLCQTIAQNRNGSVSTFKDVTAGTAGGGIMLVDMAKARDIGFMDEDFKFGWGDDGEFYHRMRLFGYECYHVPPAICAHFAKERSTQRAYAQLFNRWYLMLETYSCRSLLLLAPALVAFELCQGVFLSLKGSAGDYARALRDVIRHLPRILSRRKLTQKRRKVPDQLLFSSGDIYLSKSLLDNWLLTGGLTVINALFSGYWTLVKRFL